MAHQRFTTARIQAARGRVDAWRRRRRPGRAMPDALWTEAVNLALEVGVYAAARGIGVAYGSLKTRLQARQEGPARDAQGMGTVTFVDAGLVAGFAPAGSAATVELVLPSGERLVVRATTGAEAVATALLRELRTGGR